MALSGFQAISFTILVKLIACLGGGQEARRE